MKFEEVVEMVTSWTGKECPKWMFCQTMSLLPEEDIQYPYEDKMNSFIES